MPTMESPVSTISTSPDSDTVDTDLSLALQEEVYELRKQLAESAKTVEELKARVHRLTQFKKEALSVIEDAVAAVLVANRMASSASRLIKNLKDEI